MSVAVIIYQLECGHAVPGICTLVSGELWCQWHQDKSPISGVQEHEWRAKCHTCRFARWAGLVKKNAEIFADAHARKNSFHRVVVDYVIHPEARETAEKFRAYRVRS